MFCKKCGKELTEGSGFCVHCGTMVSREVGPPSPMPPPPIHSSQAAASEDRRMAIIIIGIVAGVALLVVFLAIVLMLALAHEDEMKVRLTMVPIGQIDETGMAEAERVIGARLQALGIGHYKVSSDASHLYVDLQSADDVERAENIIGTTAQLQFRQVLEIIGEDDPAFATTAVTRVDPTDIQAYVALKDQEVVLEKEVDGNVYKVRLGPTRLTGDIIADAQANAEEGTRNWRISFALTYEAASRFAEVTKELSSQTQPLNMLAIVVDYIIESYPSVHEEITGGEGQITGSFTREEAEDLALVLKVGALPVDFTTPVVEEMP